MSSAFEGFIAVHQYQLTAIPEELWQPLFMKLGEDYLDAGTAVELHYGDAVDGYSLHVKQDTSLKKHGEVFLIDHAWTTTPENARKELRETPALLDRLENLMDIEKEELETEDEDEKEVEADDATVKMVAEQANVSYEKAKQALEAENNEVVNAIMHLTMDEDFKKEADRLQEQVMGQLIASGKAQEKEDKVNKEKEERRKKRQEEWLNKRIENVYNKMWSYIQTYSFSVLKQDGEPETQTAWYINDEVGSAFLHSSDPNVICVPFIFSRGAGGMIPYSVFFPIKDIAPGEVITCDLLPKTLTRAADQHAYLFAFEHRLLESENIADKRKEIVEVYKATQEEWNKIQFKPSDQIITAEEASQAILSEKQNAEDNTSLKVYTTTEFVRQFLKLPNVRFVDSRESADIVWSSQDFSEWEQLKANQIVNQFPNESCLTFKQNLANLIQRTWGQPTWLPTTYNIMSQLSECVGNYLDNEDEGKENLWILKPWNFARGLEIRISTSLPEIIRQHDSPTPKIAQHYLTKPCLYNGKKFDLRYIVLLRRIQPTMVACVYNMFWIRLANKKFHLDDLNDYERQFTVMNYSNFQMTQLDYKSFIRNMEKQHAIEWTKVQADINDAMKDVLSAAATQTQPLGLLPEKAPSYDAFSVYGFDVMLTDDFKPIIVEVNFSPDCTRACQYDPEFVNNIFGLVDGRLGRTEKSLEAFTVL
ncbi:hypothetical protein EC973_004005 [Apophysomyces ossiformis]|uniref:Tubulin--tyrosine ligase-like protein 12 SET-like domain-containing protein n=1 Tax=Apophysomyces ossiformis TaxID=679940 RepID=A0A8H7BVC7_9FUNG|nr:hypothetical protein EC973_004005 [Apophysomyces ossiformis]